MARKPPAAPDVVLPPPDKEPPPPDLINWFQDDYDQYQIIRQMCLDHAAIGAQERELKKIKKPLTDKIKILLTPLHVHKAMCEDVRVTFYGQPRTSFSQDKLRAALLKRGMMPGIISEIISECQETKLIPTLKITPPGAEVDDD